MARRKSLPPPPPPPELEPLETLRTRMSLLKTLGGGGSNWLTYPENFTLAETIRNKAKTIPYFEALYRVLEYRGYLSTHQLKIIDKGTGRGRPPIPKWLKKDMESQKLLDAPKPTPEAETVKAVPVAPLVEDFPVAVSARKTPPAPPAPEPEPELSMKALAKGEEPPVVSDFPAPAPAPHAPASVSEIRAKLDELKSRLHGAQAAQAAMPPAVEASKPIAPPAPYVPPVDPLANLRAIILNARYASI